MSSPGSAAVIGSTGLVGSHILSTLLASEAYRPVHTITRRAPKPTSPNLHSIVDADTSKWASSLSGLTPPPAAVFSALGTTRAAAGGIANQWKIDHDLNIELARAALAAGVKTFVFISSAGTRGWPTSYAPFSRMKVGVEDTLRDLGFEHAIVLRPALLLGERDNGGWAEERAGQAFVRSLGRVSPGLRDYFGQDADVIARAAVRAAKLAEEGKAPAKYWSMEGKDILKLGREEWPELDAKTKASGGDQAAE